MPSPCAVCGEEVCYVHCIYCGADCTFPEPPHTDECPTNTGLFPVRPEDLGHECVRCHERTPGMACPKCNTEFKVGDIYCHQTTDRDDTFVIVCMTCAALAPTQEYTED